MFTFINSIEIFVYFTYCNFYFRTDKSFLPTPVVAVIACQNSAFLVAEQTFDCLLRSFYVVPLCSSLQQEVDCLALAAVPAAVYTFAVFEQEKSISEQTFFVVFKGEFDESSMMIDCCFN